MAAPANPIRDEPVKPPMLNPVVRHVLPSGDLNGSWSPWGWLLPWGCSPVVRHLVLGRVCKLCFELYIL